MKNEMSKNELIIEINQITNKLADDLLKNEPEAISKRRAKEIMIVFHKIVLSASLDNYSKLIIDLEKQYGKEEIDKFLIKRIK